ncbi:hypothetical protein C9374_010230 [Naegleria lovaniensis]|uniref:Uncharacterized protein n=1 Tax=Naegleria lovaniensis TaxID=51637 RepID=A0AA88KGF8_NAELO|nr:uncharacterized protein C9374_010230 [Naegleria lovaniensis]KAG2374856.1 hypothetical protein C9374_010230 [Naegleria lovaniensis]
MAWVSRSIREISITNPTTTGENIGPGCYLSHDPIGRTPRYASAPFSSTEKRKTITSTEKFQTPGPGSYHKPLESPYEPYKKDASSVFKSATSRFNQSSLIQSQELPGPGSYFNHDTEQYLKRKTGSPKNKRTSSPRHLSTAPSIPANSQSHGYEEGPNGELIRQSSPVRGYKGTQDDSIGPGAYFSDENTTNSKSLKNQGIFSSNTKRHLFKLQDTPGPGTYSDQGHSSSHADLRNYVSVFNSKTKRSSLIPPDKLKSTNLGPGSYETKEPKYMKEKKKQLPFGSTTSRPLDASISTSFMNTPGPGEYFKKDINDLPTNQDVAKVHGAFNSKSERFIYRSDTTELGPGSYISHDSNSLLSELSRKTKGSYGVFGSTTARFTYRETKPSAPPPGSYNPSDISQYDIRKPDQRSFVFQSRTKRTMHSEKKPDKDVFPSVGQYHTSENWSKKSFNISDPKTHGFSSSSKRFRDTKILDKATLLGPNYLPPGMANQKPKGINIAKSLGHSAPLLENSNNQNLGPGSYDSTQTWLKPSYNVTIAQ